MCNTNNELPNVLYHYTSWNTFEKIVKNKTWRFSSINNTNDLSEDLNLYIKQLLSDKNIISNINSKTKKELIDLVEQTNYYQVPSYFIACFSKEKDDLGQWRVKYGDYGKGVCIGIKPNFFTNHFYEADSLSLGWAKIEYEVAAQKKILNEIICKLNQTEYNDTQSLVSELRDIAMVMKHKAFHIENEWRLVTSMVEDNLPDENFIPLGEPTDSNPYYIKNTNPNIQGDYTIKCIDYVLNQNEENVFDSIILGKESDKTINDVKQLLEVNNFKIDSVKISKSDIPYDFKREIAKDISENKTNTSIFMKIATLIILLFGFKFYVGGKQNARKSN